MRFAAAASAASACASAAALAVPSPCPALLTPCARRCLGGHLAARCAMFPQVSASFCFFATDIHSVTPPLFHPPPSPPPQLSSAPGHVGQLHRPREPDDGATEGHQARAAAHARVSALVCVTPESLRLFVRRPSLCACVTHSTTQGRNHLRVWTAGRVRPAMLPAAAALTLAQARAPCRPSCHQSWFGRCRCVSRDRARIDGYTAAGVNYGWIEVNAQHAFIRDEMSKV